MNKLPSIGVSVLVVGVLVAALGAPAGAQSSGLFNIVQLLANLQESVDALAATLDEHAAAPAVDNVRYTPEVLVHSSEDVACGSVNVANEQRLVNMQVISQLGGVATEFPVVLQPGQASIQLVYGGSGNYYCRFTVADGSRADIRGAVRVFDTATGIASQSLSAE